MAAMIGVLTGHYSLALIGGAAKDFGGRNLLKSHGERRRWGGNM